VPIVQYRTEHRPVDRRGVLLHGLPGTGKTWALGWVQAQVADHATVIVTTPAMFGHPFAMSDLFKMAVGGAPTLVIMEDLDLTITARSSYGGGDALGELLASLDGPSRALGVFVAATTNHIEALDHALTQRPGRFDRRIEVGDATEEARRVVISQLIARIGAPEDQITTLVARTSGWTLAEIEEAGTLAVLTALDLDQPIDVVAALGDVHRRSVDGMAVGAKPEAGYV
ncbi:MAG: ATP-binding protein, partial [Acidobacteria bacterium]|nr:ATP-binding protein [Acidobacteriota bacterium]